MLWSHRHERKPSTVSGVREFWYTALLIAVGSLPIVFVALAFLHAARAPQWAWRMIGRTQVMWLAGLLIGAAVIPLGIPGAVFYFWKIRPTLDRVERGELSDLLGENPPPGNTP